MYEKWLDIRDYINNKLIRFLFRHTWLDNETCWAFVQKVTPRTLNILVDEFNASTPDPEDYPESDYYEDWDNLDRGFDPYMGSYSDDC